MQTFGVIIYSTWLPVESNLQRVVDTLLLANDELGNEVRRAAQKMASELASLD